MPASSPYKHFFSICCTMLAIGIQTGTAFPSREKRECRTRDDNYVGSFSECTPSCGDCLPGLYCQGGKEGEIDSGKCYGAVAPGGTCFTHRDCNHPQSDMTRPAFACSMYMSTMPDTYGAAALVGTCIEVPYPLSYLEADPFPKTTSILDHAGLDDYTALDSLAREPLSTFAYFRWYVDGKPNLMDKVGLVPSECAWYHRWAPESSYGAKGEEGWELWLADIKLYYKARSGWDAASPAYTGEPSGYGCEQQIINPKDDSWESYSSILSQRQFWDRNDSTFCNDAFARQTRVQCEIGRAKFVEEMAV